MTTLSSRRALAALGTTGALALGSALLVGAPAGATPAVKVTICHATNSQSHPYVVARVDASSIDEQNNKYLNGHGDHAGPVWTEGIADHSWGDIIPSFTYTNPRTGEVTSYSGSDNWSPGAVAEFCGGDGDGDGGGGGGGETPT